MKAIVNKNILLFYPHNFYELSSGTHRRVYDLLCYFRDRGFVVDLLTIDGFTNSWKKEELQEKGLFSSARAVNWGSSIKEKFKWVDVWRHGGLPDFATASLRKAFGEMIKGGEYGFVFISYAYWAGLLDYVGAGPVKVIDLHDFLTLNNFQKSGKKRFAFGKMFEDEVSAVGRFDYALSISAEESLMLGPFCPDTKFVNVPISSEQRFLSASESPEFDCLFIGSANPFNRAGMDWFFKEVYPMLKGQARIAVVGEVSRLVKGLPNVTLIGHADDLRDAYSRTRLAICPLRSGTGLKVKVVEALSYGVPVVTTSWGLTGIVQKYDNGCCLADTPAVFAEAILRHKDNKEAYLRLKKEAEVFFLKGFSIEKWKAALDAVFLRQG